MSDWNSPITTSIASKMFQQNNNLTIHFDSIFSNSHVHEEYHSFLKTEFNQEPLNFLSEAKKIQKVLDKKQQVSLVKSIMDEYIRVNSKSEINISHQVKETILQKFQPQEKEESWILEEEPIHFFDELSKVVKAILYHDSWKRFIRSKFGKKIMETFYNDPKVCSPTLTQKFDFDDEYFMHPFIEDKDFDFAKSLFNDGAHWELIHSDSKNQINTFYSKLNYLPNLTFSNTISIIKYEAIMPFSLQKALLSTVSNEGLFKSDPNITRVRTIDFKTYQQIQNEYEHKQNILKYERSQVMIISDIKMPFPLNPRVDITSNAMHYDSKEKAFYCLAKPYVKDNKEMLKSTKMEVALSKGGKPKITKAYTYFNYSMLCLKVIDDSEIIFSQVNIVDLGGSSRNKSLFLYAARERGKGFKHTMTALAKDIPNDVKISDYKEHFNKEENGIPIDGLGKLLLEVDLNN
eukprot:gene4083-7372_t